MSAPRRALIVIDAQNEYVDGPLAVQFPAIDDALAAIVRAIAHASDAGAPVALVQHESPEGSPVFAAGSAGWRLHPDIDVHAHLPRFVKNRASVFTSEPLLGWLADEGIDTVTLTGFMTNNCVLATAAAAEPLGLAVEVLRDATGAIPLSNEAGSVSAREVHETLMALLHSNWARVADVPTWAAALAQGEALPGSNLIASAQGPAQSMRT